MSVMVSSWVLVLAGLRLRAMIPPDLVAVIII
jgi:hypothetical protein